MSFASEEERLMSDRALLLKAEERWKHERGQLQEHKERVELLALEISKKIEVASKLWDVERQRLVQERDDAERRAAEARAELRVLQASVEAGGGGLPSGRQGEGEVPSPGSPVRARMRQIEEEEAARAHEAAEDEGSRKGRAHALVAAVSFVATSALLFRRESGILARGVVKVLDRQVLRSYRERRKEARRRQMELSA